MEKESDSTGDTDSENQFQASTGNIDRFQHSNTFASRFFSHYIAFSTQFLHYYFETCTNIDTAAMIAAIRYWSNRIQISGKRRVH
jgi:hypothetical protein